MMRTLPALLMLSSTLLVAGCLDADAVTDDLAVDLLPPFETRVFAGSIDVAVATPHLGFNYGGDFRTDLPRGENTTGYVLELVWEPTDPMNQELSLWVRDAAAGAIEASARLVDDLVAPVPPAARADGTGPLRLVVLMEDLDAESEYAVLVRAPGSASVVMDQPFQLHITVFTDAPVDEAFTALAEEEGSDE